MAKRVVTPEQFLEASFPLAGNDASKEFWRQKKLTSPLAVNVRAEEPVGQRRRGGQRMGLVRFIDARVNGDNPVQHLNVVVDPQSPALWGNSPGETGRPLGPGPDDGRIDTSTNNNAAGRGPRTSGTTTVRRKGNGVQQKRPTPTCTITTRTFAFDPIYSELLLSCVAVNCAEAGVGSNPLPTTINIAPDEHVFLWYGGGLPTVAFVNTSIASVTGNSLTYCTGFTDVP